MADKPSTSWRLCPMFYAIKRYVSRGIDIGKAGARARDGEHSHLILETAEPAPEIAFLEVLTALDLTRE